MKYSRWTARAVAGGLLSVAFLAAPAVSAAAGIKTQNVAYDIESKELVVKAKLDGFEAAVDVTVADVNGIELGSTYSSKQFLLKIPYDSILDVPCQVSITAGEENVWSEVKNCPGPGQTFEVILSGVVTDEPIPFATVSVTLDGVTYTTTADEFGNYELPVLSSNLNQLMRIDAAGTSESGTPIEFTNLTGTFSRVLDGESSGNVTNVTTASYVLTLEANDGQEPTTAEELASAETAVDATELFELAALIKLIVDDPAYSLPEGETSLIEFISDPLAVESFAATVPQEDLDAALGEILADSNLVAGFTAEAIPSRYYDIPDAEPGFIARQGDALEFEPGNRGALINSSTNQPFGWSIDGAGRLVIVPDSPVVTINFPSIDTLTLTQTERDQLEAATIGQVRVERYDREFKYTRITDGTLVDVVRVEITRNVVIPPIELGGGDFLTLEASVLSDLVITGERTFRSSLDIETIPFTGTCPGGGQSVCAQGVWGGEFYTPPGAFPWLVFGDLVTLNSDGTITRTLGADSRTWSVDPEGKLVLSYADDSTQTLEILDELGLEYGIFSEFRDGNGALVFGFYTVYSRADAKPTLTEVANPAGTYYNGEVNSWIPGSFDENGLRVPGRRFGWRLNPDGSGERRLGFPAGSEGSTCKAGVLLDPMAWELTPEGAVQLSYSVPNNFVEGGRLYRIRTWYPAAEAVIDGDRVLYVLEADQFDFADFDQPLAFPPRLNIQREIQLQGDFCPESIFDRTNDGPAIRPQ